MVNGCSYGKVTRQIVKDFKENTEKQLGVISKDLHDLSNHYSKRLPSWASAIGTIGGIIIGGLLGIIVF